MHLNTLSLLFAYATATALGTRIKTPTEPREADPEIVYERQLANTLKAEAAVGVVHKRAVGGIYLCYDAGWKNCGYKVQPLEKCISLTAPWLYTISSFGPDQGTWVTFYGDTHCETMIGAGQMTYPGSGDLRNENLNDRIGSFKVHSHPPPNIPPNTGPGSPFNPYRLIQCQATRTYDPTAQCNTDAYCLWTKNNNDCKFKGGNNLLPGFKECADSIDCPGKGHKCRHGLCCNTNVLPRGAEQCPSKGEIDACCFQRTPGIRDGTGMSVVWQMQPSIPGDLTCGC